MHLGYLSPAEVAERALRMKSDYGRYLADIAAESLAERQPRAVAA